jgi:hypothetical protein
MSVLTSIPGHTRPLLGPSFCFVSPTPTTSPTFSRDLLIACWRQLKPLKRRSVYTILHSVTSPNVCDHLDRNCFSIHVLKIVTIVQGLSKKTIKSTETENQERLAAFESCKVRDRNCFIKFPSRTTHSPPPPKNTDIKYSDVWCLVRKLYAINIETSF